MPKSYKKTIILEFWMTPKQIKKVIIKTKQNDKLSEWLPLNSAEYANPGNDTLRKLQLP